MDIDEYAKNIAEVSGTFTLLNEQNQEYILGILRALMFAQTSQKEDSANRSLQNQDKRTGV